MLDLLVLTGDAALSVHQFVNKFHKPITIEWDGVQDAYNVRLYDLSQDQIIALMGHLLNLDEYPHTVTVLHQGDYVTVTKYLKWIL